MSFETVFLPVFDTWLGETGSPTRIDNLTVTDKSETNNNPTESTTSVQHQVLLPPTPKNTPSEAPLKYTEQDNKILKAVMPILFKLTPLLTVDIFERYQEAAQFKVVEAECAAMYENTKRSHIYNEVSKILDDEQSVKAPLLKSVISSEVQIELKNMRNQVKNSQHKIDQANKKLMSLRNTTTRQKVGPSSNP